MVTGLQKGQQKAGIECMKNSCSESAHFATCEKGLVFLGRTPQLDGGATTASQSGMLSLPALAAARTGRMCLAGTVLGFGPLEPDGSQQSHASPV
jgi:hypothetical protein